MDFFQLLDSAHPYLSCFDYDHYPQCFAEFEKHAEGFFGMLDESVFPETAEELLNGAAARWDALPRRDRAETARKDKTVLALFFTPAAERHSERAKAFAALLQERWNRRFPRNRYLAGNYEAIIKGFDTDFLGITLRKTKQRSR